MHIFRVFMVVPILDVIHLEPQAGNNPIGSNAHLIMFIV